MKIGTVGQLRKETAHLPDDAPVEGSIDVKLGIVDNTGVWIDAADGYFTGNPKALLICVGLSHDDGSKLDDGG